MGKEAGREVRKGASRRRAGCARIGTEVREVEAAHVRSVRYLSLACGGLMSDGEAPGECVAGGRMKSDTWEGEGWKTAWGVEELEVRSTER